jgi:sigma-E factor negative regulatory protein RseC
MMTETGRVVALDDDAVWVETIRLGTCGSCAARSGCGHGLLASMGRSASVVRALRTSANSPAIALHDEVRISIPERSFLRGVALLYLMPLLCLVAGALLVSGALAGEALTQAQMDLRVTVGALLGLASGLGLLWLWGRRHANDPALQPVVTERL